jgi:hypothetical protein
MNNAEQVAYQSMLRDCENSMFGGDVQDDVETPVHVWVDAKRESPTVAKMVWVAVPNAITCRYQTLLCYMDSDDKWRDASGILMFRRVSFWQYADVPQCEGVC